MEEKGRDPLSFRESYPPEIREWWEGTLKSPKLVVAPMVDASELPWRMLSRRYKADLCFTPMLHSRIFTEDHKYQAENLYNCCDPEDRPLIVQFCGNDPDVMVKAATLAKPYCDGIDINLGCPQRIAKNGHYGAFLMDEWDLIATMVKRIREEVQVPISCKIRIFPDMKKTVEYAKAIVEAGAYMLTVHGRTREQKGMDTGLADWSYIRAVRNAVNVPVLANGNIQYLEDVHRCIEATGVEGIMSAEGNLYNPKIFAGSNPPAWEMALEYLELVQKHPCPIGFSRGHLFKIFHHLLVIPSNSDVRTLLAGAWSLEEFFTATKLLKERYERYVTGEAQWSPDKISEAANLPFPPYLCQPYVRPPKKIDPATVSVSCPPKTEKRKPSLPDSVLASLPPGTQLSNNKIKKMAKKPNKNWGRERLPVKLCSLCTNPQGVKCSFTLCRKCCRSKCFTENLDCEGHKIFVKKFREISRLKNALKSAEIGEEAV